MIENPAGISVLLHIDNYESVAAAYGVGAVDAIHVAIRQSLGALHGVHSTVAANDPSHLRVDVRDRSAIYARQLAPLAEEDVVEHLLRSIASIRLSVDGSTIRIAVSVSAFGGQADSTALPLIGNLGAGHPSKSIMTPTPAWCRTYREDMCRAVVALEAIENNRLQLFWQPVRHALKQDIVLYHECLARIVSPTGEVRDPATFIPALEHLGLVRPFDCDMVQNVIQELSMSPGINLAVNISAESAVDDPWWNGVKGLLRSAPELARRLVIEITETRPFRSISATIRFAAEMRALGCRIALDDFGVGSIALREVIALKPDIVKVDAFYVNWAAHASGGRTAMVHILRLLQSLSPIVIVEGVETEAQSVMIVAAGADWQQGYHHGVPSVVRPRYALSHAAVMHPTALDEEPGQSSAARSSMLRGC